MAVRTLQPTHTVVPSRGASTCVPVVLLAFGVPWGILGLFSLTSGAGEQLVALNVAAGWFVLFAVGYLGVQSAKGAAWWSIPVLLTIEALFEFVCVPEWRFATGDERVDSAYVHAMMLTLIGFIAFWVGSILLTKERKMRFIPESPRTSSRVSMICGAMLVLGLAGNLVLWRTGLFSYTADSGLRESSLGIIQYIKFVANLLGTALLVAAIEVLGKRSTESLIRIVFWLALTCSIAAGIVSGMKGLILRPLVVLVLVYGLTRGRIHRAAFLLPVLLIVIYPFVNAYRDNLNNGYRAQSNTIGGLQAVLVKSFDDVFQLHISSSEKAGKGFDQTTIRLSLLAYVHDIIDLPAPSLLNGEEKVWLAPIYPLVPRALWKSKPVLNKGQRLSVALGRPDTTSSASTIIGDLYMLYGTFGVAIGMLIYGICAQLYMNWVSRGDLSERRLFIYLMLLVPLTNLEVDTVALVALVVQSIIVAAVTSYVIYGKSVGARVTARLA